MKDLGKCSFVDCGRRRGCTVQFLDFIFLDGGCMGWAVLCVYCTRWVMGVNIERRKKRIVLKGIGGVELELELEAEGME